MRYVEVAGCTMLMPEGH